MFWNLHWKDVNRGNLYMYVGLRDMAIQDFVLNDPVWLKTHSGPSRYGAKFFTSEEKRLLEKTRGDLPEGFSWLCGSMRYKNALEIDAGAVNIQAIANALASAAKEVADHQIGNDADDPAIFLMVEQLAHLTRVGSSMDLSRYKHAKHICEQMCNEGRIK